ncbi:hypothetical protein [Pseudomonas putida]
MTEIVWSGEGLPPVGTVCEFNSNLAHKAGGESWHKVTVVFMSDETYVVRRENAPPGEISELCGSAWMIEAKRFRQFKTPEQIAEKERANAITSILADAGVTGSAWSDDPEAEVWAAALHDAGYRKQVAP